jgi:hypothetical protein
MSWYYVESGQQQGPVEESQLHQLAREGRIQGDTLVWKNGMPDWQPYRAIAPAPAPPVVPTPTTAAATGHVKCASCGNPFPPSEVVSVDGKMVCATCKPGFLQRMQEGAPVSTAPASTTLTPQEIINGPIPVDIGTCFNRALALLKADPVTIIGGVILVGIAGFFVAFILGIIPVVGPVLAPFLSGIFSGGLFLLVIKKIRGQSPPLSEGFSGFGPRAFELSMAGAIQQCVSILLGILGAAIAIVSLLSTDVGGALALVYLGVTLLCVPLMIYVQTIFLFGVPLVIDKGMKTMPAVMLSMKVVHKKFFSFFVFTIVAGLLMMAGVIACIVGLVVTVPLGFTMLTYLYNDIFAELAPGAEAV